MWIFIFISSFLHYLLYEFPPHLVSSYLPVCLFCLQVQLLVEEYNAAHLAISQLCSVISELLLVHVDGKTVYKDLEFEQVQQEHQQSQLHRLNTAHQNIIDIMNRIYETFRNDGPKVCAFAFVFFFSQTVFFLVTLHNYLFAGGY